MQDKLSFIIPVKIDNMLRLKNLRAISHFYFKELPKAEFIFVEERDKTADYIFDEYLPAGSQYKHIINTVDISEPIHKTANYNEGAKIAKNDILVFIDLDIIVDTKKLISEIKELLDKGQLGVHIGYTGTSLYMTQKGEEDFLKNYDIESLFTKWKNKYKLAMGVQTEDFTCMNINSVGGCLVMSREAFYNINGFNPNYRGWGYEDNEVVIRAHNLKQNVTKSNDPDNILYHLPHNLDNTNPSQHKFYEQNQAESAKVDPMPYEQLKEYIKTW